MKRSTSGRAFVAVVTSAAFLWTLALSASPQLHQRIHSDANRIDHACAVTFVTAGNVDHAPVALLIATPVPLDGQIPELTPLWVGPLFLIASVFEHAPPANS
ncbi:MAG TPA: hypothetical protein VIU85_06010 [Chthoniobacterales bacterium]